MTRAQVMQWLLVLGRDWVGISAIYRVFKDDGTMIDDISFWDVLQKWHDNAHTTKRYNTWNYENPKHRRVQGLVHLTSNIEQYKLTKKALTLLGERTEDE